MFSVQKLLTTLKKNLKVQGKKNGCSVFFDHFQLFVCWIFLFCSIDVFIDLFLFCDDLIHQILDQRIDKFINTSENVCNNNNEAKPFIQNSISELKRYWNDLKRQANELEQNIENIKQYFAVNEQVIYFPILFF